MVGDGEVFQHPGIEHAILVVVGFAGVEDPVAVRVLAQQGVHVCAVKEAQLIHRLEGIALALVGWLLHGVVSDGGTVAVSVPPIQDGLRQVFF